MSSAANSDVVPLRLELWVRGSGTPGAMGKTGCAFVDAKAFGNFLALQPLCTQQDHPAPIQQRTWRFVPPNLTFEKNTTLVAQYDQIRLSPHHPKTLLTVQQEHIQ